MSWAPICIFSHAWSTAQLHYGTASQECFAVIMSLRKIRAMGLPVPLIIQTDHANLTHLEKTDSNLLKRWLGEICSMGDISLQHVPGTANSAADGLSRITTTHMDKEPPLVMPPWIDATHHSTYEFRRGLNISMVTVSRGMVIAAVTTRAGARALRPPAEGVRKEG